MIQKGTILIVLVGFLAGCASTKPSQPQKLDNAVRTAVRRFEKKIPAGTQIAIPGHSEISSELTVKMENYLIDEITDRLVNRDKFRVLDRKHLNAVMAERNFQLEGNVDESDQLKIGEMAGAKIVISVTVIDLGDSKNFRFITRALDVQKGEALAAAAFTLFDDQLIRLGNR